MKIIFAFFVLIAIFALVVATEKGNESLVATMADLAKERQEIKEMFRRENEKLRAEADNLRRQDDQLRGEDEKIRAQNEKLQKEMAKLRRELRKSDLRVKTSLRQKDQNESLEFEKKIRQSIRQKDLSSELKKMMRGEIQEFLINERICETGTFSKRDRARKSWQPTVQFTKTFPRPPTVHASISAYGRLSGEDDYVTNVQVNKITVSSVKLVIEKGSDVNYVEIAWIACL